MAFSVKIKGSSNEISLGQDVITSVNLLVEMPKDSNARTADLYATMIIKGKVLTVLDGATGTETLDLLKWSMVSAENSDCYRSVEANCIAAGQVVRNYKFPNSFIVDYTEDYSDTQGIGTFTLVVRQKKDMLELAQVTGGFAS
jgi:hypothetical protein